MIPTVIISNINNDSKIMVKKVANMTQKVTMNMCIAQT